MHPLRTFRCHRDQIQRRHRRPACFQAHPRESLTLGQSGRTDPGDIAVGQFGRALRIRKGESLQRIRRPKNIAVALLVDPSIRGDPTALALGLPQAQTERQRRRQPLLFPSSPRPRLGAPQKLTTSARIDLPRSQADHAAWHADGRDRHHPCRRRAYRCIGSGTDVLPARPDQASSRRRGSAVGAGWSKRFGEYGWSILRECRRTAGRRAHGCTDLSWIERTILERGQRRRREPFHFGIGDAQLTRGVPFGLTERLAKLEFQGVVGGVNRSVNRLAAETAPGE